MLVHIGFIEFIEIVFAGLSFGIGFTFSSIIVSRILSPGPRR